jgi:hypothetical protein
MALSDDDMLHIVAEERRQSVGFDHGDELAAQITLALNYAKGEMPDVTSYGSRSKAVSTDVSDAVETALPDLIEIFVGGDDVATFQATGPDDEEQAKQETEFVLHTIFDQNPGFLLFYSIIKDALLAKIGIAKSWVEEETETEERELEGPLEQIATALQQALAEGFEVVEAPEPDESGTITVKLIRTAEITCQKNQAVPPEDFTFARDTVVLRDTTYCAMRSRPRAQKLIEDGYDAEVVDRLPAYGTSDDDAVDQARDTVQETDQRPTGATRALRTVEIVEHYIRIDADEDGKTELWRVVTGGGETVLLDKEKVDLIPFAVITPFIVTHRLVGRSLADMLLEIQRIKTALLRMLLDSGWFALNQRVEVADAGANAFTISDLLRNEPGMPIRSKTGEAVRPIQAGALGFDVISAIEQVNVISEQRTGIVRNAQGLNPDTLHDTAKGAQVLIGAAQKRLRMIARVFAETGIKDLFLNVHDLLRKHGKATTAYVGGSWAQIDPSTWPKRKGLKVEIGVGSGGREHDIIAGQQLLAMMQTAVQGQQGLSGPLVNPDGLNKALRRQTERLGFKDAEQYWQDPKTYQAPPPSPPPEIVKAQIDGQVKQQQAQQQAQIDLQRLDREHQLALTKLEQEMGLRRDQLGQELVLKRQELEAELALKAQEMQANVAIRAEQARRGDDRSDRETDANISSTVKPGGEPG